ncbi:MAG: hypothetical protein ACLT98_14270 [Eggerthellaceae bacterium]
MPFGERIPDFDEAAQAVVRFACVNNWDTCDSMSPKAFAHTPEAFWKNRTGWLECRFHRAIHRLLILFPRRTIEERFLEAVAAVSGGWVTPGALPGAKGEHGRKRTRRASIEAAKRLATERRTKSVDSRCFYYVNECAWYFATALANSHQATLRSSRYGGSIRGHNKAIEAISRRISTDSKAHLRTQGRAAPGTNVLAAMRSRRMIPLHPRKGVACAQHETARR